MKRFWAKVDTSGECWTWTAWREPKGYGTFWLDGRMRPAHRVAWEMDRGPIPDELTIDHLCRNRACVRVDHLRLLTRSENSRDNGHATKTHCKRGHEYRPGSWRRVGVNGRRCLECVRIMNTAEYRKAREMAK